MAYKAQDADAELLRTLKVKPHSVRHVATSLGALRTCSMDEVLGAGTWASPTVFLKHYVQYYSTDDLTNLSRVGNFVAAGSIF